MTRSAANVPEKVGDRVVCPDGSKGVVAHVHPTIRGAVIVTTDPEVRVYMRTELELDV